MNTNKDIQEMSDEQIKELAKVHSAWKSKDKSFGVHFYEESLLRFVAAILATRQPAPVASTPAVAVPEAVLARTEEIRKMVSNPAHLTKGKLEWMAECLLAHIAFTNAAPQPSAAPVAEPKPCRMCDPSVGFICENCGEDDAPVAADVAQIDLSKLTRYDAVAVQNNGYVWGVEMVSDKSNTGRFVEFEDVRQLIAPQPPADAAPAWDADATKRLRSIVDLLGMRDVMPDGDLTGYEFAVLGFVRREIERLKAAQPSTAQGDGLSQQASEFDNIYHTGIKPWSLRIPANQPLSAVCDAMQAELNDLRAALAQRATSQPDSERDAVRLTARQPC